MQDDWEVVLASASPRRAELLRQIGVRFAAVPADVDESRRIDETIDDYVLRVARAKAESVLDRLPSLGFDPALVVLGADTVVVLDESVLGKPVDAAHAIATLRALSGREHCVLTALAVAAERAHGRECRCVLSRSIARFRALSEREIHAYATSSEPYDKAGAYGIQGVGGIFVDRIEGSYSGIMGLPLVEAETLLSYFGIDTWRYRGG